MLHDEFREGTVDLAAPSALALRWAQVLPTHALSLAWSAPRLSLSCLKAIC